MNLMKKAFSMENEDPAVPLTPAAGEETAVAEPVAAADPAVVEPGAETELPMELQEDSEIANVVDAIEEKHDEGVEIAMGLESLFEGVAILEALKADGVAGGKTAQHVIGMYRPALSRKTSRAAMESISNGQGDTGTDIALEGLKDTIRNGLDNYFQDIVLTSKHQNEGLGDLFRSASGKIAKLKGELSKTQSEFNAKKAKFRDGKHHASLIQLWQFFSTTDGQSRNLIKDLDRDIDASNYIMQDFLKDVLKTLSQASSILGNAQPNDEKGMLALFGAIDRLPSLQSLFDPKYIGDGILFNVTSIECQLGEAVEPVQLGGKTFAGLAENSRRTKIKESGSFKHGVKKAFGNGALVRTITDADRTDFELTTEEIAKIIEAGQRYAASAEAFMGLSREIQKVTRELEVAIGRLRSRIEGDNGNELRHGLKQVLDYVKNLNQAISSPCGKEFNRALMGAKFCNYLGLRMIWNASKYFK